MSRIILRDYQINLNQQIKTAWGNHRNVLAVLPTGGGKTVLFGNVLTNHNGACLAIAHRQELVSQISLSLAKYGVYHRVIGQKKIIRWINQLHVQEVGKSFYRTDASCAVAGVDTLIRSKQDLKNWCNQVSLWVIDEAHHVLRENKWGKAVSMFPNAKGLGVTATPCRADGFGLGSHADGVMDCLVEGPNMRQLINQSYLSDYRIFAPPSDLDLDGVKITASGDFSKNQLKARVLKSQVIGDVVKHYLRIAPGKLGVTFADSIETATEISRRFNEYGVSAAIISSKTSDFDRVQNLRKFRNKEILQLVNVDLFGEGFDLPALEVVSMARATASYGLYCQQFGRALRVLRGKEHAIIIDHVGNVTRHGLPDSARSWSLDRREKRSAADPDKIATRTCKNCFGIYEAYHKICPFCFFQWVPSERSAPEFVDGDLEELSPEVLAMMRGEVAKIDEDPAVFKNRLTHGGLNGVVLNSAVKNHKVRQEAQQCLRNVIALWGGYKRRDGQTDSQSYRQFYHKFGTDVLTAQTLGRPDAEALTCKILEDIRRF